MWAARWLWELRTGGEGTTHWETQRSLKKCEVAHEGGFNKMKKIRQRSIEPKVFQIVKVSKVWTKGRKKVHLQLIANREGVSECWNVKVWISLLSLGCFPIETCFPLAGKWVQHDIVAVLSKVRGSGLMLQTCLKSRWVKTKDHTFWGWLPSYCSLFEIYFGVHWDTVGVAWLIDSFPYPGKSEIATSPAWNFELIHFSAVCFTRSMASSWII